MSGSAATTRPANTRRWNSRSSRTTRRSRRTQAADYARQKLEELVRRFENPEEPYRSLVLSMWTARYGDYDNLARVKEWSAAGGIALEEL